MSTPGFPPGMLALPVTPGFVSLSACNDLMIIELQKESVVRPKRSPVEFPAKAQMPLAGQPEIG